MMQNRPTRILYFVSEDWYFWSHRLPVARKARDQGFKVTVATRVTAHGDLIRSEGFELAPISLDRSGMNPIIELRSLWQVYKIYRAVKPDIVHHVALKPALYGSWAAALTGVPAILNAYAGLGHLFTTASSRLALARLIFTFGMIAIQRLRGTWSLFQNDDDRALFTNLGIAAAERSSTIRGSGVDVDYFHPPQSYPTGVPIALLASRMLKTKGVEDFVETARILQKRGVPIRMALAGEPDPYNPASVTEEWLQSVAKEGVVEYMGRIDDMPAALALASIAVLPSHYREGLPKSLLEAAAAGLPIVAFDIPGCREIVRNEVNGLLTPSRDQIELADALERLARDRDLRMRWGAVSRKIAVEEFSDTIVADQTFELYEQLLQTRK
ncbi:MAG: glycosyltransferase family 4 protein [Nitrospinae bacterium]|nr:glycosyltransferase family 4 protein [Nitrospinota bacterium]